MAETTTLRTDQKIDAIMGHLLRTGVVLTAILVFSGGVVFLIRHHQPVIDYRVFQGEPEALRSIPGIFKEAWAFRGQGLIQLGLLVLIATPVARVVFSVLAFLYQRDWIYVVVTILVLGLLLFSLFGGRLA
jgi:uncharacterized membrane protein